MSDSRVIDALQQGGLERLLRALRCDTAKDGGSSFDSPHGFIHCPMPGHADANPSCSVVASAGIFVCRSACDTIVPADLVVAHGHAPDRAGAMRWIEDALELSPDPGGPGGASAGPKKTRVEDPSLTVAQYLALKGLSNETTERFGLIDAHTWVAKRDTSKLWADFEAGFFATVVMPTSTDGSSRPRARSRMMTKPANKAIDAATGETVDFASLPPAVYGLPQLAAPSDASLAAFLAGCLIVVEGESDVHTLHDAGVSNVVGVPGVSNARAVAPSILAACRRLTPSGGASDADLAHLTVLVWVEGGDAGSRFPTKVSEALQEACSLELERTGSLVPCPRVVAIPRGAITVAGEAADDPSDLLHLLAPLHHGSLAPARAELGRLVAETALKLSGRAPNDLDPEAPAAAILPSSAIIPPRAELRSGEDPWALMDCDGALPAPDAADLPRRVEHLGEEFARTEGGWEEHTVNAKGETVERLICGIVNVTQVRCVDGADELVVEIPRGHLGVFETVHVPRAALEDPRSACAPLRAAGLAITKRQSPAVCALLQCLAVRVIRTVGVTVVPPTTGWTSGRAGTGPFAGIEEEPSCIFGKMMWQANEARRAKRPDTASDALEWWTRAALPLLTPPAGATPAASHAAPLLSIGAAAAAPLLAPLLEIGVKAGPVVWLAGLGGGGKTITQTVCAAIFAPSTPAVDGQAGIFASANMTQAALGARVDNCRDLPLILDDITQIPTGSASRARMTDAQRVEKGATLGMQIFNRRPIERATQGGEMRMTRPFRSTALFSAEINMNSSTSGAVLTAGQRRRVTTVDARPMSERGLGRKFVADVHRISSRCGGAAGELLIERVRTASSGPELRDLFFRFDSAIAELAPQLEDTQRQSISVGALGFALLHDAIMPGTIDDAFAMVVSQLGPYFEATAAQGGATTNDDLGSVDRTIGMVEAFWASHPESFITPYQSEQGLLPKSGFKGIFGKQIKNRFDGSRQLVVLPAGLRSLAEDYGLSEQMIESARAAGLVELQRQARLANGARPRGTMFVLPPLGPDETDDDPSAPGPHDPDPHGLAPQDAPRIPGSGVATSEPDPDPAMTVVQAERWENPPISVEDMQRWAESNPDALPRIELTVHALLELEQLITEDFKQHRPIIIGDEILSSYFHWSKGVYVVKDLAEAFLGPNLRPELVEHVRREAREEFGALQAMYAAAAKTDPAGAVEVPDLPSLDDPRLAALDSKTPRELRGFWRSATEHLQVANRQPAGSAEKSAAHAEHVKWYRLSIIARLRLPQHFVIVESEL